MKYWRFPYGATTPGLVKAAAFIVKNFILGEGHTKGIVLMHEKDLTAELLPEIIRLIKTSGLTIGNFPG